MVSPFNWAKQMGQVDQYFLYKETDPGGGGGAALRGMWNK